MRRGSKRCNLSLTRRDFLSGMTVAGGGFALNHQANAKTIDPALAESRRPNILLFITDQQHARAVSALGNPMLSTPAQDRLVQEGVVVEKNYCTSAVCKPSRSSMMTGRMPTETGVWINTDKQPSRSRLDPEMPSMGGWLNAQAGYDTIYAGKEHLPHANTLTVPGFRVLAGGTDHRGDLGDLHVSRACEAYLRQYAQDGRTQPFLMVCSLVQPHDICHWLSINQNNLQQPWYPEMDRIAPLPPLPDNFKIPEPEPAYLKAMRSGQQPAKGGWECDQWRYYLWNYYRHVEMVDAEIGRVLNALEESGLTGETLVVLTSDHGESLGEHQMVRKSVLYDSAARVPLIARLPGFIPANHRVSQALTSGLDLFPTFCDYAGIDIPLGLTHARSLRSCWEGDETSLRDVLVVEDNEPTRYPAYGQPGRKVRTLRYSYIHYYNDPAEMLFDMESDPGETRNIAQDPACKDVLEEHRRLLRAWESRLIISRHVPESPWASGCSSEEKHDL